MCERCGAEKWSRQVDLLGGRKANLCNGCRNEWHAILGASPIAALCDEAKAKSNWFASLTVAEIPPSFQQFCDLAEMERQIANRAFELSGEFMVWPRVPKPNPLTDRAG